MDIRIRNEIGRTWVMSWSLGWPRLRLMLAMCCPSLHQVLPVLYLFNTSDYLVIDMTRSKKVEVIKGEHQNVARAALVLNILAGAGPYGLRMTDVIEQSGLGVATVHRLLGGLISHQFVDHDDAKNRYFLGMQMITWAAKATERYGLAPFVESSLNNLVSLTEDTVYLSLISGHHAVCIDRREGAYPIRTLTLRVGDRRPLGIGAGSMALLAYQTDEFIQSVLTQNADERKPFAVSSAYIKEAITETNELGYALNNEKLIKGMSGVGVPIRQKNGQAVAAISVAAITSRLSGKRLKTVAQWLKDEASTIEQLAGDVLNIPYVKRFSVTN